MIMMKKSGADKRKGKLNNAGFSLVEVLVAMAVLAILSIPVLGSFSNAARINHKARKEENANTVASDIVEQFKSVSMSRILEDYAGKYTESSGKYIFRETKEGTNGEEYTVVTELDPGIYNSGDDSDKNYNNNINSYVNSVKNIVLREDLYSHDIDAENYFKERYTAGFDENKIEIATLPGAPNQRGYISYWILDPKKTQEVINRMIYRDKPTLDGTKFKAGIMYSPRKEEEAQAMKEKLSELGFEVNMLKITHLSHTRFVANKNDVTIDFLNWLQKKMPELNNMQFIYDPTETFSVGSDFTIVLAEG